jgi:hypothetical protein
VVGEKLHSRQVWQSPDGRNGWLAKLPTDPEALLKKIYQESDAVRDPEVPRDQAAFVAIGDLLTESYPPVDLRQEDVRVPR